MDLTTPVTMDQVVKERERKERVWKGQRHGQTTSLDEIEPLEPQRAHHTTARAASPHTSHSTTTTLLCTLSIVTAANMQAACWACPALPLCPCPALHIRGLHWLLA